ncbi:ABC transporter ATP-binding protein [Ancylobacter amanitiformis]|uniref:Branched-chain amino acid transport system ATP-binding protein n=1 Tax=Ancylobacter amanitiformis TaxID=217069 RepID=A0ABU0LKP6_9HYPH|nr:ABC transporter ATP-binding protein [Ancylobacter amanitiformis]MDQ0509273.1 branched-chain amino acid transport system ATP-binding protein [Ancylobacter amanitiformis]
MLEVGALQVRYGEAVAVEHLDLALPEGGVLALIGANGAGKSSTLAAISGVVMPARGSVRFGGRDITRLPPEQRSRLGIALVPEGRRVFAALTVAENLTLGGAMHLDRAARAVRAEEMLVLFPVLRQFYRARAGTLSGGQQQMLAIARALMARPKLLMIDEPSLGLAPKVVDDVFDLLAALKASGLTMLLVEQNVALALDLADSALVLATGRVVLAGPAPDVAASELVRHAYLGH